MQVFPLRVSPNSLTLPTAACLVLSSDLANSFAYSETSFLTFFLSINLNYLFGKQPTLDILHMLGWEHKYQCVYINLRSLKMDLDCHAFLKHTLRRQYVCLVCTRKEPSWGGWPPPRVNFFFFIAGVRCVQSRLELVALFTMSCLYGAQADLGDKPWRFSLHAAIYLSTV